jgi:hypothetical protein
LLVLSIDVQAGLEAAATMAMMRNGAEFSQDNVVWGGFHRLSVQDVETLILVDALFLLDGGRREGKKRK